jgi:hypothetical protein
VPPNDRRGEQWNSQHPTYAGDGIYVIIFKMMTVNLAMKNARRSGRSHEVEVVWTMNCRCQPISIFPFALLLLVCLTCSTSAYYPNVPQGQCPHPPANTPVIVPTNNTRLLFIGPHHTGTTSYIKVFVELKEKRYSPLLHPGHDMHWADSREDKIFQHDVLADTPYYDFNDHVGLEFGHRYHPDVRTLYNCFPKSLYVINTRPIIGYLKTKLMWELSFDGHPTAPCQTEIAFKRDPFYYTIPRYEKAKLFPSFDMSTRKELAISLSHPNVKQFPLGYMSKICQVALVRERLYLAFLNFINEDLIHRQPRFLITDIEKEDMQDIVKRLCKFVHINVLSTSTSTSSVDHLFEMKKQEKINFCNKIELPPKPIRQNPSLFVNLECQIESFEHILMNATGTNAPPTFPDQQNTRQLTNECHKISNTYSREELLNDSSIFLVPGEYKTKYKELIEELSTRYSA